MRFREKLRRGRSHLLIVAVMILAATIVVSIDDQNLAGEMGHPPASPGPASSDGR